VRRDKLVVVDTTSDNHVGDPQRVDGGAQRDQRKIVEQQEAVPHDPQIMHAIGPPGFRVPGEWEVDMSGDRDDGK
jgi:hypothetical protein